MCSQRNSKRTGTALSVELESAGIPHPTVSLRRVAEWIERSRLKGLGVTEEEGVLAERARLQNNLGTRLRELGRREEALAATQEAVVIRRALAQARPECLPARPGQEPQQPGHQLERAGAARGGAGGHAGGGGHPTRALATARARMPSCPTLASEPQQPRASCSQQAGAAQRRRWRPRRRRWTLYRALAQTSPDAFLPDLARSLNNLGHQALSELGRREEALAATQEAVDIYRRLAQTRARRLPARSGDEPQQPRASALQELGRREEALAATQEAVDL